MSHKVRIHLLRAPDYRKPRAMRFEDEYEFTSSELKPMLARMRVNVSSTEENNLAVLSIVGALLDYLVDADLVDPAGLGMQFEYAAAAHDDAGEGKVGDRVRSVARALLDDRVFSRLNRGASSLRQ